MREVEEAVRAVDEHEPEREQAVGRAVERAQREIERLVELLQVVQDDSLSQRPWADVDGADVQGLHAGPGGYRPGDDLPAART